MLKKPEKSRNLSVIQLFEILQEEFLVCELRAKIYPLEKHKSYWNELAQKKKEKIKDIAQKNRLFSIFDDKRVELDFIKRVIPEVGFPKFIYKDDNQRLLQEKWDIHNYYLPGARVKFYQDSQNFTGILRTVDFAQRVAMVSVDLDNSDSDTHCDLDIITRIL